MSVRDQERRGWRQPTAAVSTDPIRVLLLVAWEDGLAGMITRSLLHEGGFEIHCLTGTMPSILSHTPRANVEYAPMKTPQAMAAAVTDYVARHPIDVIMPVQEVMILNAGAVIDELRQLAAVVDLPTPEICELADDKGWCSDRARAGGIAVPLSWRVTNLEAIAPAVEALTRPVLVKPVIGAAGGGIRRFERGAHAVAWLRTAPVLRHGDDPTPDWMIEEVIEGIDAGASLLVADGALIGISVKYTEVAQYRHFQSAAMVSRYGPDPAIEEICQQFVEVFGWAGPANLDLKVTPEGEVLLLEVNPRYWASMMGDLARGMNFPAAACRRALGGNEVIAPGREITWLNHTWLFTDWRNLSTLRGNLRLAARSINRRIITIDPRLEWATIRKSTPGQFRLHILRQGKRKRNGQRARPATAKARPAATVTPPPPAPGAPEVQSPLVEAVPAAIPDSQRTRLEGTNVGRVEVFDSLADAESTWRQFEAEGAALPYQRFDWVKTWYDTISDAQEYEPCPVAVRAEDGSPLLFLPVGVRSTIWRGRPTKLVAWLGESIGDQLAPIVCGRAGELGTDEVAALWRQVIDALPPADVATLHHQPTEVYGVTNPLALLPMRQHERCQSTRLSDDWDAYFKTKAKSTRRGDSRRQRRRLGETGEVEFRILTDPNETKPVVDTMIEQKRRRYEETGRADMFIDGSFADFYHRLTADHPELIQLSVLTVDGEIIATDWSAVGQRTFHGLMTTHEGGDWRQYSPGRLLMEWVLAWCCGNDIDVFDFSTGDEGYKKEWCERSTPLLRADFPLSRKAKARAIPRRMRSRLVATRLGQAARNRRAGRVSSGTDQAT